MISRAALIFVLLAAPDLRAEETPVDREAATTDVTTVRLKDGSVLVGTIAEQDAERLRIVTVSGAAVSVLRESVQSIEPGHPARTEEVPSTAPNPDDTRLFLAPSGRPLRKGSGYFSDHWVFFPGVAYGVTDNFTLAGGASLIPGLGFDEQVAYFTPKLGARLTDSVAVSAGGLLARGPDDVSLSVGYVVSTVCSKQEACITGGVGAGRVGGFDSGDTEALVMLGGSARISKRLSLLSENWFVPDESFELFSAGLRFHGDRLTVDVGVLLNDEIVDEGIPLPWLSFAYHW
jgi:hypothetical protein